MSGNDDYVPHSPDLSDYAPQSPVHRQIETHFPFSAHRASYDASPYFSNPSQQQFLPSVLPVQEQPRAMARGKKAQAEEVDEWTPESEDATYGSRSRKARKGGAVDPRVGVAADVDVKT